MEQSIQLLPCPFCGSDDLELCNTHTPSFWVECHGCEAQVHGEYFEGPRRKTKFGYAEAPRGPFEANFANLHSEYRKAAKSAIAAWNRRA